MNSHFSYRLDTLKPMSRFIWIVFILILSTGKLFAGNLTLSWDPSTSTNVGGYKIYYGISSKKYTANVDTGKTTSFQVTGLTNGSKYFFAVKAYNVAKTIESSFSNEVSATVPSTTTLSSNFTTNKVSGSSPLVVTFTPNTTGTVTGWSWNFGTTSIPASTSKIPTVTYSTPGTYNVKLTVTGPSGAATLTKVGLITVNAPTPIASFSATPKTGNIPLSVGFNDASSGNVTSHLWNFGDGTTSTAKNPSHKYTKAGSYNVSLKVSGPNGSNIKTVAGFINATTASTSTPPTTGLVAVYNFDETRGTIIADASGKGNHGLLKEAIRVIPGHYHKALKFDGVNDWISVKDSPSLDLSAAYTFEAWVRPLSSGNGSLITKEQPGGSVYSLYASEDANRPIAALNNGTGYRVISGNSVLPINKWTHLASTYNGSYQRLYINGVQVAIRAQSGLIKKSNGALRIGGNSIWGEYFHGYIDDIRIYNRALSNAEITKDFTTATNLTSPSQILTGNKVVETAIDSNPQGMAEAFKTVPQKNSVMTNIRLYIDASSSATELVAGLYSDNLGHPGKLLAQGKLKKLTSGAWNRVGIPTVNLVASRPYWIAILGSKGQIKFRDRLGYGNSPLESSASTKLTTLPTTWVTGKVYPKDGPLSSFGVGYTGP